MRNTSPRVNPDDCRTCGECCKNFMLFYPHGLDRLKYDEMIRLVYLSGTDVTIELVEGGHWVIFNHPCKYLLQDQGGVYSCDLIDDPARPLICSLFPYPDTPAEYCPHLIP